MKIVISLGGSILTNPLSADIILKYAGQLNRLHQEGHGLIVVCGGGSTCKQYQRIAEKCGANDEILNRIGTQVTHLNAYVLIGALQNDSVQRSPSTYEEIDRHFGQKIIVTGGLSELLGPSTDYDAALYAERYKADLFINATDVDFVYDKNPKEFSDAKALTKATYDELLYILRDNPQGPMDTLLFDREAVEVLKRNSIKLIFINGNNPENLANAIAGKSIGTVISNSKDL
ncbi:MAG: UMP kinase [Parcubacteria group bacterium]